MFLLGRSNFRHRNWIYLIPVFCVSIGEQVFEMVLNLFVNTSTKDEDEIYPVTVSEIAAAMQKHRLYKNTLRVNPSKIETR